MKYYPLTKEFPNQQLHIFCWIKCNFKYFQSCACSLNSFEMALLDKSIIITDVSDVSVSSCYSTASLLLLLLFTEIQCHACVSAIHFLYFFGHLQFVSRADILHRVIITTLHHCAKFSVMFRHNNLSGSLLRVITWCQNTTSPLIDSLKVTETERIILPPISSSWRKAP
jgi:hypothetical protein